jgi:hypothetical protein
MMVYKTLYWLIGVFFTRKFKPAKNKHKYAILIAARNEKNVIGETDSLVPSMREGTMEYRYWVDVK